MDLMELWRRKNNHSIGETRSTKKTQKFYGLKGWIFHVLHKKSNESINKTRLKNSTD
jgi:hypothetical protein